RVLDREGASWLVGAATIAFVIRAIAPHRMVMVYFGYEHVGQAVDLATLPRYGPGATLLWWVLFRFVEPDHEAVQWLHAVLGSLTVGFAAAFVHRATRRPVACGLAAAVLAFAPLFVR